MNWSIRKTGCGSNITGRTAARLKTPLLLMHGLFNRETLLDLQPDRSVVGNLLKEGAEVYLIEWGSPTRRRSVSHPG